MPISEPQEESILDRLPKIIAKHPDITEFPGRVIGGSYTTGVWVYKDVRVKGIGEKLAMKVLIPSHAGDIAKREQEAKRVYGFHTHPEVKGHPHVLRLYGDYLRFEGSRDLSVFFGILMEQAERNFSSILLQESLNEEETLDMIVQAAEGLVPIHLYGIHRDIKPSNLLRMRDGRIVVADFGQVLDQTLQRALETQTVKTAPSYQSPELVFGKGHFPNHALNDVFALGSCLYAALAKTDPPDIYQKYMEWRDKKFNAVEYQQFIYQTISSMNVSKRMKHYLMRLMGALERGKRPSWMNRGWEYRCPTINVFIDEVGGVRVTSPPDPRAYTAYEKQYQGLVSALERSQRVRGGEWGTIKLEDKETLWNALDNLRELKEQPDVYRHPKAQTLMDAANAAWDQMAAAEEQVLRKVHESLKQSGCTLAHKRTWMDHQFIVGPPITWAMTETGRVREDGTIAPGKARYSLDEIHGNVPFYRQEGWK